MSEEKLLKSFNLGGLPMPSIAVMKAKEAVGNSDYGNISLVFQKDTINPELSPYNKVYSGDAWNIVYPIVEYKINEAVADENRRGHDSDILLGYGETGNGERLPAYFVVSKLTTGTSELIKFGSLYSINAKKLA